MLDLIATVIACCDGPREPGPGHPPAATVRVLATLRRFLREGTPWRSLTASEDMVSGSTLRRWLERWARGGVLAQVHALLVAMLRGDPTLILDSCSVRAKRAGDLTGPNPTDRGKQGTSTTSITRDGVPSPAQRRRPTSMTRSSSSACSWPPSPSWPGSRPCSPTKGMMPRATATYAAVSALSRTSTSEGGRTDRAWADAAGRWSAATPGCWRTGAWRALRPARLHCAVPTPGRLPIPGCRQACPRVLKTASKKHFHNYPGLS